MFHHPSRDVRTVVHGDDFTSLGDESSLDWLAEELKKKYELKVRAVLGPDEKDAKTVRILNRVVSWTEEGLVYEPDQRHSEIIVRALNLGKGNGVSTPGVKDSTGAATQVGTPLSPAEATLYRSLSMRAQYLAQDRPDIQYPSKEPVSYTHLTLPTTPYV